MWLTPGRGEIERVGRDIAPVLARERNAILFELTHCSARQGALSGSRPSALDPEAARTLERWRITFPAPAPAWTPRKGDLARCGEKLASLGALFGQNVFADEKAFALVLVGPTILPACRRTSSPPRRRRPHRAAFPASIW